MTYYSVWMTENNWSFRPGCAGNKVYSFLHGAFKNGLNLVSEYHFEKIKNPFLCPDIWKYQTLDLDIILRCLRTHYFIQTFEKSYCLSTDHLFKIYNDLFIHLNVWEWWWLSFIEPFWDIQYLIFSFRHLKMVNI